MKEVRVGHQGLEIYAGKEIIINNKREKMPLLATTWPRVAKVKNQKVTGNI